MRKLFFTAVLMLMTMTMMGQESFTTNRTNAGAVVKMEVKWDVSEDGTVTMTYLDKRTVKMMERSGQPTTVVMPYKVTPKHDAADVYYFYQDDSVQLTVMPKTPSVSLKVRDSFMGTAAQTLYFNM